MLNPDGGPGASILSWFGSNSAFFGDPKIALGLVVLVQVWMGLGVNMIIYLSGLQAIPTELYEVASIDGSSAWQRFRHVTFPLLAPARTASVALSIVGSFGSYQLAYVLTGASNQATSLLSLTIFTQGFGGSSVGGGLPAQTQGYAAALSAIQFVITGVLAFAALGYLRRREHQL